MEVILRFWQVGGKHQHVNDVTGGPNIPLNRRKVGEVEWRVVRKQIWLGGCVDRSAKRVPTRPCCASLLVATNQPPSPPHPPSNNSSIPPTPLIHLPGLLTVSTLLAWLANFEELPPHYQPTPSTTQSSLDLAPVLSLLVAPTRTSPSAASHPCRHSGGRHRLCHRPRRRHCRPRLERMKRLR